MSSTTLVTFLFQAPKAVARVELLGSWDNFSKPYPMQRDRSAGTLDWRGCHSFTDIVCDGNDLDGNAVKRDGGLKMGGTYWYYYRLDNDSECFNPKEPHTTSCPLLPGQCVNVLDVPTQEGFSQPMENTSVWSLTEQVFTLNPADKYVTPQPPSPEKAKRFRIPGFHRSRTVSRGDSALSKFFQWSRELSVKSQPTSPPSVPTGSHPRNCASEPTQSQTCISQGLRERRRHGSAQASFSAYLLNRDKKWRYGQCRAEVAGSLTSPGLECREAPAQEVNRKLSDRSLPSFEANSITGVSQVTSQLCELHVDEPEEPVQAHLRFGAEIWKNSYDPLVKQNPEQQSHKRPTAHTKVEIDHDFPTVHSSKRTSGVFSLSESMAGYTDSASPQHRLSQPMTPSMSEFGEPVLDAFHLDATAHELDTEDTVRQSHGFLGYNLPEDQHASAITIKPNQSPISRRPALGAAFGNSQLVQDWNDGHEHHPKSALQDFVEEMGYLRNLIT